MYLLRGISPRLLSILCSNDIGKVIPNFSVLSGFFLILLTILVTYVVMLYMHINIYHGDIPTTRWLRKLVKKVLHLQAKRQRQKWLGKAENPRGNRSSFFLYTLDVILGTGGQL